MLSEKEPMLVEQLIRATLEMQGFRIASVEKSSSELLVTIVADLRYHPRCGRCGNPSDYRDTQDSRRFRHVPLWGIPVTLAYGFRDHDYFFLKIRAAFPEFPDEPKKSRLHFDRRLNKCFVRSVDISFVYSV